MTKKEIDKEKYLEIGRHRMKARKEKRKQKYADKIQQKEKLKEFGCRGCGEDPYCYCGDGTPYSY